MSIATLQSLWYPGYLCDQMIIDTLHANTGLVRQFACVSGRIRFDRLHQYIKENRQRLGCRDLYSRGLKWIEKHLFSLKCEQSNSLVISQRTSPARDPHTRTCHDGIGLLRKSRVGTRGTGETGPTSLKDTYSNGKDGRTICYGYFPSRATRLWHGSVRITHRNNSCGQLIRLCY